jgi:hypothetical protein
MYNFFLKALKIILEYFGDIILTQRCWFPPEEQVRGLHRKVRRIAG